MKARILLLIALLAGFFASCDTLGTDTPKKNAKVKLVVKESGMTKAGGERDLTYLESNGFLLDAILDDEGKTGNTRKVSFNSAEDTWEYDSELPWFDVNMRFWAYTSETKAAADFATPGKLQSTLSFSYPADGHTPDGSTDLMFAYNSKTYDGNDESLTLMFEHAMAKVQFDASDLVLPTGYTKVDHVLIRGMKNSGEASFNGSSYAWSGLSGNDEYSIDDPNGCFLVVPQNAKDAIIQIKLSGGTGTTPIYLQTGMQNYEMKAGKKYTYKLKVTSVKQLSMTMTVSDWDDDIQNITFTQYNVTSPMAYDGNHSIIDNAAERIIIENLVPVRGTFTMSQPIGAHVLLTLDGNVGAFEIQNPLQKIDGNPIEVVISPTISDPKKIYQCHLHVFLMNHDGTTEQIDDAVLGTVKDYTIILPAN